MSDFESISANIYCTKTTSGNVSNINTLKGLIHSPYKSVGARTLPDMVPNGFKNTECNQHVKVLGLNHLWLHS